MIVKAKALRGLKRGAAAVEFALILPFFLTILFCTMDYGWMFFQQLAITSAAREGARAGALAADGSTSTQIGTLASAAVNSFVTTNGLKTADTTTTTTIAAATNTTPEMVTVTVKYKFTPLVGVFFLPAGAQPYPTNLTSSAVMRREF